MEDAYPFYQTMTFSFTGPVSFPIRMTEVLLELVKLRQLITMMRTELMATLQELKNAVAANTAVDQSAIVLLNGLTVKIQELLDAGTELSTLKAGLQEVVDEVNADTRPLPMPWWQTLLRRRRLHDELCHSPCLYDV